jgi:multidrug efflux system membrane fusion protein
VWTVVPGGTPGTGKATARVVTLGTAQDGRVAIRTGLSAGALVVVRGNENLREGQDVRIVRED